jgi:D-arginine dehydrogenase
VYGFDPAVPGFFWCAGQGGVGIQTAPAAAKLCAHLILPDAVEPPPNVNSSWFAPARLAAA